MEQVKKVQNIKSLETLFWTTNQELKDHQEILKKECENVNDFEKIKVLSDQRVTLQGVLEELREKQDQTRKQTIASLELRILTKTEKYNSLLCYMKEPQNEGDFGMLDASVRWQEALKKLKLKLLVHKSLLEHKPDEVYRMRTKIIELLEEDDVDVQEEEDDFFCPISCELLKDPVLTSNGQTYERSVIEEWFKQGHNTDPKTNLVLDDRNVSTDTETIEAMRRYFELLCQSE